MADLPLSCSGTPEGVRCLCGCFSFLSSLFFPLLFCLFLFFFLGLRCSDELPSSFPEAVVGLATLLCSEDRLLKKNQKDFTFKINHSHAERLDD